MKLAAAFLTGVALWPVLEYALHRFLAHEAKFKNKFRTEHLKHHRDRDYYAAGLDKVLAAAPAAGVLFCVWAAGAGSAAALAFTAGFFSCYLLYERAHKRFHTHPPKTKLGLRLRKHHFIHHFVDARSNHGVTTTLFDALCGTLSRREQVAIPRAFVPPWMLEAGREDRLAEAFRHDFRLA